MLRIISLVFILMSSAINSQVLFENQAEALGAGYPYGFIDLGAGISFYDYNNDGWDDITIAGSNEFDFKFLKNLGGSYQLENLGIDNNDYHTKQVIWVDFDNDGDNDFFSASFHDISRLYRNEGNGTFTDITIAAGFPGVNYEVYGASWGDYNNDGFLDVFLSVRDDIIPNLLYKNNGDGTFSNVTIEAGLETIGYMSFCSVFFDFNNDGFQDIFVANDKYDFENLLYKNNGDGTFDNVSGPSGTGIVMDAMSATIGDYNNDGWMDLYVTNSFPGPIGEVQGNVFFKNNGDGTFTNIAASTGTNFDSFGWGAVFLDADNDSRSDLYVSGSDDGTNGLSSAFYYNNGSGTFTIPSNIGFEEDTRESYSNAIGDVDNDGYPEIIVLNNNYENSFLWKNLTPHDNNWLKVKLQGVQSNRMGVGSLIEISSGGEIQYNYTLCGEGYLGQNSAFEFFGLGNNTIVDYVKVTWLSGSIDYLENVSINQELTIVEGSSPLSINDHETMVFRIYPNPTTKVLFVEKNNSDEATIFIYTITGKKVYSHYFRNQVVELPLDELSSGTYIVKIISEKNSTEEKLIIE